MATTTHNNLFDVSSQGLRNLLKDRRAYVSLELVSNAFDAPGSHRVEIILESSGTPGTYRLVVQDDDPNGFVRLSDAYTLFADSIRKDDPTARGRFNMGEKSVIALCSAVTITSTTGSVTFDVDAGVRHEDSERRTEAGSQFFGLIDLTDEEYQDALEYLRRVIVPADRTLIVNGQEAPHRAPVRSFTALLVTVLGNELRRTERTATVALYEPREGEPAHLFELGIPVVATGDRFDVDISQKVPLSMQRDNVQPAYLRHVRTVALNHSADLLTPEEAAAPWVGEALRHRAITPEAISLVLDRRFGEKRVVADPAHPEATKLAVSQGYTVITAGSFDKAQWAAIRGAQAALPAGRVMPSPSDIFNDRMLGGEGGGGTLQHIPEEKWDEGMRTVHAYAQRIAQILFDQPISVGFVSDITLSAAAWWHDDTMSLTFNKGRLGNAWFAFVGPQTDALLLHELAHHRVSDHLSHEYGDEVAHLGALLLQAVLRDPEALAPYRPGTGEVFTVRAVDAPTSNHVAAAARA